MLNASFGDLRRAGCIQCESMVMFAGLMSTTRGDPCETDCAAFEGGKCRAYQRYHTFPIKQETEKAKRLKDATTPNNGTGEFANMTIRQIAKAGGISLSEVRRRKAAGAFGKTQ